MPLWKQRLLSRLQAPEPGDGGGAGGGGSGGGTGGTGGAGNQQQTPQIPAELQPAVQAMVDAAVIGLKNKNTELLGAQRQLKDDLKKFEGIDPEVVHKILEKFSSEEEAALIAKGDIEKVLTLRTDRMRSDFDKKLKAEVDARTKVEQKAAKLAERATAEAIIQAAVKAGAEPTAHEDIILRAKSAGWTINDDGEVVVLKDGEPVLGKDGKTPLSPIEWAETLRETAPHLWPRAQGSGAPGSGRTAKGGVDLSQLSPEARLTYARENNMVKH